MEIVRTTASANGLDYAESNRTGGKMFQQAC